MLKLDEVEEVFDNIFFLSSKVFLDPDPGSQNVADP